MSILVTGGAGFIGSHLVERLLRSGYDTVAIDDFNDFYSPELKRNNISGAAGNSSFFLIEADIRNLDLLKKVLCEYEVKKVVHLAARAGVRSSIENPFLYEEVNVRGTLNILEVCRQVEIENLLVASSSSVYGNSTRIPFREDDPADRPISPYAATKRSAEMLCHTYHHLYGIPITCVRFFTVYGPRQRPDMAFHTFARKISAGQPIKMFGDGTTRRDYTFISDIVDGLVAAMDKPQPFEIVNFGNSKAVELRRILEIFQEQLEFNIQVEHYPEQPGDVRLTSADISKAQSLFGYNPKVDIEEGIGGFVEWYSAARGSGL